MHRKQTREIIWGHIIYIDFIYMRDSTGVLSLLGIPGMSVLSDFYILGSEWTVVSLDLPIII